MLTSAPGGLQDVLIKATDAKLSDLSQALHQRVRPCVCVRACVCSAYSDSSFEELLNGAIEHSRM